MKPQPKAQVLFDQGSAKGAEDNLIFQPPSYYGVLDGFSGVYLPRDGPRMFDGRTGGQMASHIVAEAFAMATEGELDGILRHANALCAKVFAQGGFTLKDSAFLPGTCFAVCQVGEEHLEILQGGDCFAIWQFKDGSIEATPNRNYSYEKFLVDTIAQLMEKHGSDRNAMWDEFRPILMERRRVCINAKEGGVCVLNGQPHFENCWQRITLMRDDVAILILCSDGLVPFEQTEDFDKLAEYVMNHYHSGKLRGVLAATRALAALSRDKTHEDFPEATAIALEF